MATRVPAPDLLLPIAAAPVGARRSPMASDAHDHERERRTEATRARSDRLVRDHYEFVWRSLARLGVAPADLDDVTQEVFLTAARRQEAFANERGFLFRTCEFAASHARRRVLRRREVTDEGCLDAAVDTRATPEESAEHEQARGILQELLDHLPDDVRSVFVLFELEALTMAQIAEMLALPLGTVASRLRRGRENVLEAAKKRGLT